MICFRFSSTRANMTGCIEKDAYKTQRLSLRSYSTLHINTNIAHLARRHSNEILCASMLYSLPLSLSLFLLFPLIVTLTGKQVLLKISRACLYDVFSSISLIDFITSFNADDNNQQRKSFIRCMIFLVRYFHP